jgi:ParB-like chromosome segregation protein Spo0J
MWIGHGDNMTDYKKPEVVEVPLAELIPYAANARTHDDAQVAQIAAAIREFGWTQPILIQQDKTIIAGHGRVLAARKLGMELVPCIVISDLTPAQIRALVIADNKLALNAGWDDELLASELRGIIADCQVDELAVGFSEDEIAGTIGPIVDEAALPDLGEGDRSDDSLGTITIRLPLREREEVASWLDSIKPNDPSGAVLMVCRGQR